LEDSIMTAIGHVTRHQDGSFKGQVKTLSVRADIEIVPNRSKSTELQQATSIAAILKRRLLEAPKATPRRYVRGLVSNIVVNRELAVITGPRAALASYASNPDRIPAVPGLVREWRA
jgi:hypothetical protein